VLTYVNGKLLLGKLAVNVIKLGNLEGATHFLNRENGEMQQRRDGKLRFD